MHLATLDRVNGSMVRVKYHCVLYLSESEIKRWKPSTEEEHLKLIPYCTRGNQKKRCRDQNTSRQGSQKQKKICSISAMSHWLYIVVYIAVKAEKQDLLAPWMLLKIAVCAGKFFNFCAYFILPTFWSAWYEQTWKDLQDKIARVVEWMESSKSGKSPFKNFLFKKGYEPWSDKTEKIQCFLGQ